MSTEPTTADMAANLKSMIGPMGAPETVPVELLAVTRMAMAVEDFDPIHFDAAAAKGRGYRGIVAPWPILSLLQYNSSHEYPPFSFGKATVHGEDRFEFHEPIIAGDRVTVAASVTKAELKHGRSGPLGLVTLERRCVNQLGQLCAVLRTIVIRR